MRERDRDRREHSGAAGETTTREGGGGDGSTLDDLLEAGDRAIANVLDRDSARFLSQSRQHGGQ